MGLELGLVVGGEEAVARAPKGLVDDSPACVPEHVHGRDVHHALNSSLHRRPEDAFGFPHVRLPHLRALAGEDPHLVHGDGVERESQPWMPFRMAVSSPRSPRTSSQPNFPSASALSGERTKATTSSPRSLNLRARYPPMNPVAPVTERSHQVDPMGSAARPGPGPGRPRRPPPRPGS